MKYFLIILNIIITSFFYFPFEFKILPDVNTKMMLAVAGLILLAFSIAKNRSGKIRKDLFWLVTLSGAVSLIGLFSITMNNTSDTAYATYFISMAVWLSAAYAVVTIMKAVHGKIDVTIVCRYLIAVCVIQCILAMVIEYNPAFKLLVDSVIEQGQEFLNQRNVRRLYGIGANLDTAGVRFSLVLISIVFLLFKEDNGKYDILYLLAFVTISVIGNIMARTTTVGMGVALAYMAYMPWAKGMENRFKKTKRIFGKFILIVAVALPVVIYLNNHNASFHRQLIFGFEGFFNLFTTGEWSTSSSDKLQSMIVFPESMKTWIMGDGYFSSPRDDINYIGEIVEGYYMGTDIGYLRFIFYFGLIGLIAFSVFIINASGICIKRFPKDKVLFLLALLIGFIVWLKVSTDVFLYFALFIAMEAETRQEENTQTDSL